MATGSQRKPLLGDDDATTVFETSREVEVVPTFDQMGLRDDLLRGIYAYGRGVYGRHVSGTIYFWREKVLSVTSQPILQPTLQGLRSHQPFSREPSIRSSVAGTSLLSECPSPNHAPPLPPPLTSHTLLHQRHAQLLTLSCP